MRYKSGMQTETDERIAANLRAVVAVQRIPQRALAHVWGVPQSAVSRRMNGVTPISAAELLAAADLLGVDVTALYRVAS